MELSRKRGNPNETSKNYDNQYSEEYRTELRGQSSYS